MKIRLFFLWAMVFSHSVCAELGLDQKLSLAIEVNNLSPKDCSKIQYGNIDEKRVEVGGLLFETLMLSGNKDTACRTCHLDEFGSADGIPLAVGVGGVGAGNERYLHGKGILVQRNAISMVGRGLSDFKNYFWDGKLDASNENEVVSQFGAWLSPKFDAPLSVASILPLIERDEFIGKENIIYENDFQDSVGHKLYQQRYYALSKVIRKRIVNDSDAKEIKVALKDIGVDVDRLELADIGNLLGRFIATEFKCSSSKWDEYLAGDTNALTESQKSGALLFYGKGRCSICHSGPLQSDFKFHSIGVPQGSFGPHSRHRDLGRAAVTLKQDDLFKFRTPPLVEVGKTLPYGHNGAFGTLEDIVVHHINPINYFLNKSNLIVNDLNYGKILDSRDKSLSSISISSKSEIKSVVEFLEAL